jgi:hypothetical protein
MSLPTKLLPPPPVNPTQVVNGIIEGDKSQSDMVQLLAGGRRKRNRRQCGGADVVEVPRIPIAYNDGGMMQNMYRQNALNSMQSTANAAGDSAIVTKVGGSKKTKTKRQRRRKSKKSKKSKKSRKTRR